MERHELEQWLCGPDVPPSSPRAIASRLGLPASALADTTLLRTAPRVHSMRFVLAVLRDAFADDADVCDWLETGREALQGLSPRQAFIAGKDTLVEALAVQAWNEHVCMAATA